MIDNHESVGVQVFEFFSFVSELNDGTSAHGLEIINGFVFIYDLGVFAFVCVFFFFFFFVEEDFIIIRVKDR